MWYRIRHNCLSFCHKSGVWRTDGQTDRQNSDR